MTAIDPRTTTSMALDRSRPNYHFPIELLTLILEISFPDTNDRSINETAELYHLRLVSKSWKELIEGTPTLWTYVSPDYPAVVLRDCLRWSKDHSLQINFSHTWSYPVETLIEFLQLLQPHSHRWKTLHYSTKAGPNIDRIHSRRFLESPAPMLQSINVDLGEFGEEPRVNLAGGMAAGLKHLILHDASLPIYANLLHGLETFGFDNNNEVPMEEILNVFVKSLALRRFELYCEGGEDSSDLTASAKDPLNANSLEEVLIRYTDPQIIAHVLSQVSMPNCKYLDLLGDFEELDGDLQILDEGLAQFMPRIREALSQGGRTALQVESPSKYEWRSSLEDGGFRFTFEWWGITAEGLIEWIRSLISPLEPPPELEIILSTADRETVEALGECKEFHVTKLTILDIDHGSDEVDEEVSLTDFLGEVQVGPNGGLSWNLPHLRELDVSSAEYKLSTVFGVLSRRYLPDASVRDIEGQGGSIQTPPPVDLWVQDTTAPGDATIITAMERHWGVKSLKRGKLDK